VTTICTAAGGIPQVMKILLANGCCTAGA